MANQVSRGLTRFLAPEHYFSETQSSKLDLGLITVHPRRQYLEFVTARGVFSRKRLDRGTRLLIESMILPGKGLVLDLGCGYGPIGIAAAVFNPSLQVVMTDTNRRAVKLARINIDRNHVSNAEVRQGWLYDPVEGMTFDSILSNPPLAAGLKKVIVPLLGGAYDHLNPGASLQIVVRKSSGGEKIRDLMADIFGDVDTVARGGGYHVLLSRRDQVDVISHSQA